jgi:hypothetical protein
MSVFSSQQNQLRRFSQFFVWQTFSLYQLQERIAKHEFVVPIIETMFQLVQISVQMIRGELWYVPTTERLKRLHTLSTLLVWTSPAFKARTCSRK